MKDKKNGKKTKELLAGVLTLKGKQVEYEIRPQNRLSRNITLRVSPKGKVLISLPKEAARTAAEDFMRVKAVWILKHLEFYHADKQHLRYLFNNNLFMLEGATVFLEKIREAERKRSHLQIKPLSLVLKLGPEHQAETELVKGLKLHARKRLGELLSRLGEGTGIAYKRFALKDTQSRWGSCSSRGSINLSWRLILAPRQVQIYVVLHELCHIREGNHSKKFWDLVKQYQSDYETQRQWLKTEGWRLHTI